MGLAKHPAQQQASVVDAGCHGKDACRLKVFASVDSSEVDMAVGCPLRERTAEIVCGGVGNGTSEGVVEAIGSHAILVFAHWDDVDTLPCLQHDGPVVLRNTGDDVLVRQRPVSAHKAVFHPEVLVVGRDGGLHDGVLNKHRRVGFQ